MIRLAEHQSRAYNGLRTNDCRMNDCTQVFADRYPLPGIADTEKLGNRLAGLAQPGDFIGLEGDLGAGKTTLARALIQQRYRQASLPPETVSSPTFNLVQIYDPPPCPIWHLDLYRLNRIEDTEELGWEQALNEAILLVEWPQILDKHLPSNYLIIKLDWDNSTPPVSENNGRFYRLIGGGNWPERLRSMAPGICPA